MVAIRIVAGAAKENEAGPGAAGPTLVGVIAGAAVAPQIFHGAVARVAQGRGALPNVLERVIADVAARPRLRRQRRAAFDRAVRLDTEGGAARAAGRHVTARHRAFEHRLVWAEVADVVARPDPHPKLVRALLEL